MSIDRTFVFTLLFATSMACSGGSDAREARSTLASPEALAAAMQTAFAAGDLAAAEALADLSQTPAMARFLYLSTAVDCATTGECTTTVGALTEEHRAGLEAQAAAQGVELAVPPEGMIKLSSTSRDGTGTGSLEMPYAKVDGSYRIVTARYSDAELAKLRAKTNQELADELFAQGIYDPELGDNRTDWASVATKLPAGGGAPGETLKRQTEAMAAAVAAADPDAAMKAGGRTAEVIFRAEDWDGTPIPLASRKLKLSVQALLHLREVDIHGGWELGGTAILLVDGRDGVGWIERGAVLMVDYGEGWDRAGAFTVSYPE